MYLCMVPGVQFQGPITWNRSKLDPRLTLKHPYSPIFHSKICKFGPIYYHMVVQNENYFNTIIKFGRFWAKEPCYSEHVTYSQEAVQ